VPISLFEAVFAGPIWERLLPVAPAWLHKPAPPVIPSAPRARRTEVGAGGVTVIAVRMVSPIRVVFGGGGAPPHRNSLRVWPLGVISL